MIHYSFRRCPYAIRARLALLQAGLHPQLREVDLKCKPPELLSASSKGTVPVMVSRDGFVIDESLELMRWALGQRDPDGWLESDGSTEVEALLAQNDGSFKHHLDRFRYPDRYDNTNGVDHREKAFEILRQWNQRLEHYPWWLGPRPSLVDMALLPFVRQFRHSDPEGFDAELDLQPLQRWVQRFLSSQALSVVMEWPWASRQRWNSPSWLYHLALTDEWQQAKRQGSYERSTRGRSLQEEGFIHLSSAHQLDATYKRFYSDLGQVVLLTIDPNQLPVNQLKHEPIPSGETFPHLYAPLPLTAVLAADRYRSAP